MVKCGLSTLHALSLISDSIATEMAIPLLRAGASLDTTSYEVRKPSKNRLGRGYGTPLAWAILKKKPSLFATLMQWCIQHNITPNVGRRSLGAMPLGHGHFEMARYLMSAESRAQQSNEIDAREFFWSIRPEDVPENHLSAFDFAGSQAECAHWVRELS